MIQRLRKRIVAINIITASLILFCALIVTFVVGYGRINMERENRLHIALDYDPAVDDVTFDRQKLFEDVALVVYNQHTQQVEAWYFGRNVELTKSYLSRYLQPIVDEEADNGWINLKIRYIKKTDGDIVKIAFNNLGASSNNLTTFVVSTLSALTVGILGYFFVSFMLARIALKPVEESWIKQKQFVADASHELKTPLSVILANTEIIASHQEETVASQMKWVENTRAAGLVADLLFLAKNDDGLKVQMEDVNLSDCVGTIVLGYDAIFYENKKDFAYQVDKDVYIVGNVGQLKQLTTILLDNANKYSKGSGNITSHGKRQARTPHCGKRQRATHRRTVETPFRQVLHSRPFPQQKQRRKRSGTQHSAGNLSDARRYYTCRMRKRTHTFCCDIPRQKTSQGTVTLAFVRNFSIRTKVFVTFC